MYFWGIPLNIASTIEFNMSIRVVLAVFLGLCIGLERELSHKSAGMKTHSLVCLGSTIFTILSIYGFNYADQNLIKITHDPARIAAQIITGIGFIGGGVVLHHGTSIKGITTAATLWVTAAIGMCIGCGLYYLAIFSTIISIIMLILEKLIEMRILYRVTVGYHCTTDKKLKLYIKSGYIKPPVRFFPNEQTARRWMLRTGRTILLKIPVKQSWPLPDHKPARWTDEHINKWEIVHENNK